MAIETHTMLALSTKHVCLGTRDYLNDNMHMTASEFLAPELVVYDKPRFGWFVPVPAFDCEPDDLPADLGRAFHYARLRRITWLMFDRDGDVVEGLQEFNW